MDTLNKYIVNIFEETLNIFSKLASIQIFFILIIAAYVIGEVSLAKELLLGILILTGIGIPIRYFLYKERPNREVYSNFVEKIKASSFPSMHSARSAFLVLIVVPLSKNSGFFFFLVSLYALICFQRMYTKKHDIYDIIGGLVLGICVYIFISNLKGF